MNQCGGIQKTTRGKIWWAYLGILFGSEPGYRRPVLIMQSDFFNNSRLSTTIVIPLTSNILLSEAPGNIFISKKDSKLSKDSVINITQIHIIDKQRLIEKISKINKIILRKIEESILVVFDIHGFLRIV